MTQITSSERNVKITRLINSQFNQTSIESELQIQTECKVCGWSKTSILTIWNNIFKAG